MTIHSRVGRGHFETQERLPVEPLLAVLVRRRVIPHDYTTADIERALGYSRFAAREALRTGEITIWVGDHVATKTLAVHPTHIWGDDWLLPVDAATTDRSVRIDLAFAQLRETGR